MAHQIPEHMDEGTPRQSETAKSAFLKCPEKGGLTDMGCSLLTSVTGLLLSGSRVCPRAGVLHFCSRNAGGVHCLAIILWVLFKGLWRITSEEWQQQLIHSGFSLPAKPPGTSLSFRGQRKASGPASGTPVVYPSALPFRNFLSVGKWSSDLLLIAPSLGGWGKPQAHWLKHSAWVWKRYCLSLALWRLQKPRCHCSLQAFSVFHRFPLNASSSLLSYPGTC